MNARLPIVTEELLHTQPVFMLNLGQLIEAASRVQAEGNLDAAVALYQVWIAAAVQDASKAVAQFNLGTLLQLKGEAEAAEQAYRDCLKTKPDFPQAHINLGLAMERRGEVDAALMEWASILDPNQSSFCLEPELQITALNHIGRALEVRKEYELAEQILAKSLHLDPKQPGVVQHWVHIRQKACKWPVYEALPKVSMHDMLMYTSPLAMLALKDDPAQQLLTARSFVERTYGFKEEHLSQGRHYQHARKRIGLVSGDLCVHAVGVLLAELLEGLDRSKLELFAYDFSPEDGTAHRQRLKQSFDQWRSIATLSDRQVAELVLEDEIDVLIDMHGLSSGARPGIFALHAAPMQGTYLGFIGTTGMPWFDFVIADRTVLPTELTDYCTEKPLYLDHCFIPMTQPTQGLPDVTRGEIGLRDDQFVMAAFGNSYKITPEMFDTWLELLRRMDNAVLWLIDDNPAATANLRAKAASVGVDVNRLHFTERTTHLEFKARLRLADLFLDTYPYNCGSTTNDVINAGVPMVTLMGKTMVSRMGASILTQQGQTRNIAQTYDEYMQIAERISRESELNRHGLPRILVKRQLTQGDVALTTPVIKKIYQNHQGYCSIDVLTRKADVYQDNPWVNVVHDTELTAEEMLAYDQVINLDLAYEKQPHLHPIDAYALFALGQPLSPAEGQVELFSTLTDKIHTRIRMLELAKGDYAVIHMRHGTCPSRNLPQTYWKGVVDTLLAHTQLNLVQIGMRHDMAFDHDPRLIDGRGQFSLQELKVLMENAQLYVGVESDTLPVAASTAVPVIAHFTSVKPSLREPKGRHARTTFIPIVADIPCQGCLEQLPAPSVSVSCQQGDPFAPPCAQAFSLDQFNLALKSAVPQLLI